MPRRTDENGASEAAKNVIKKLFNHYRLSSSDALTIF